MFSNKGVLYECAAIDIDVYLSQRKPKIFYSSSPFEGAVNVREGISARLNTRSENFCRSLNDTID